MYELEIQSETENYRVQIGIQLGNLLREFDAVVIDKFFQDSLIIEKPVYWVESKESNKNLSEVESICAFFQLSGLTRNSRVLAVGGGIIQDLVTLSASIYMRGIRWTYLPTTLTGMMDSCLGGKSSINVGTTKNLVGNIYPPTNIFIDTQFVTTLDRQSLASGLSEAAKIVFARGPQHFLEFVENKSSTIPRNDESTQELIFLSLSSKKWFIEVDEFDKAERQLLNFGHSFGHAFEAACGFSLQHGLGVALGVLAALIHPQGAQTEHTERLKKYCEEIAKQNLEIIRVASTKTDWSVFQKSLRSDKKNTSDCLVLILPGLNDPLQKVELPFSQNSIEVATETMRTVLKNILNQGKQQ
jgi:3-dehydroquinate synthase